MSGYTTNVPTPTIGPVGVVVPSEPAIFTGVQADYIGAFGSRINPALTTPQGQLETSTTAIISDADGQFAALANNFDPAYSQGRYQDALGRIYFLTRIAAQPTSLQVACGGLSGVVIPVGALIADPNANVYSCTSAGTIGAGGSVTLGFANQITGPIAVPSAVAIYQSIPGWNTVSVVSGAEGNLVESRAAFELRRQQSVAGNAQGVTDSVLGAVLAVSGVLSAYVVDNPLGTTSVVGGVTLNANSLYVAVYGGSSAAVALAIWQKKPPGCAYNGNTTVNVQDPNPAYNGAGPIYPVTFQTATPAPFAFIVTIKNSSSVPSNAATLVQNAVQAAFTGADGGMRAGIGATVYASRYYAGVAALGTWAQIETITIGTEASPTATFTGSISGTALTVSGVTGTIAIGQFVYAATFGGVAAGTTIISGSGTSWVVAVSQTVASTSMASVAATANLETLNIMEMPTLANGDIQTVLV
jgi:hypothetical protein